MHSGKAEVAAFDSLQAFWPALQVLAGDVRQAAETQEAFHSLWVRFKVLPERYDVKRATVHSSMSYYPLRPELAESTYALYRATGDHRYLRMGAEMVASLNSVARTPVGAPAISRRVLTHTTCQLRSRLPSLTSRVPARRLPMLTGRLCGDQVGA